MSKTGICPICNKSNQCAVVNGKDPQSCWCTKVKFTEEIMNELKVEILMIVFVKNVI